MKFYVMIMYDCEFHILKLLNEMNCEETFCFISLENKYVIEFPGERKQSYKTHAY